MLKFSISLLVFCLAISFKGHPQSALDYTFTSDGKLVFSEVIEVEDSKQNDLYTLAVESFSTVEKVKKDSKDKTISIAKRFTLHDKGILSRIPYAEIKCQLFVEFKDQRYRYQLKGFDFVPYARNRYGKYETVERKRKSLESVIQSSSEWEEQRAEFDNWISSEIENLILTMEGKLAEKSEKTVSEVIEIKEEW